MVVLNPQPERQVIWDRNQRDLLKILLAFRGSGQELSDAELEGLSDATTPGGLNRALRTRISPTKIENALKD